MTDDIGVPANGFANHGLRGRSPQDYQLPLSIIDGIDINGPEDLNSKSISAILNAFLRTNFISVKTIRVEIIEAGVLSLCLDISLQYESMQDGLLVPDGLVAKIPRKELPLPHMMQVEKAFYLHHAKKLVEEFSIPFMIPQAVYCTDKMIILERLRGDWLSYSCVQGAPEEDMDECIRRLAMFHARCWVIDSDQHAINKDDLLSHHPGIGASLDGHTKEQYFPLFCEGYIQGLPKTITESQKDSLRHICTHMCQRRVIREVHDFVQTIEAGGKIAKSTLIHGDFHLANIMFRKNGVDQDTKCTKFCLLDWATCGIGNPLRDLAFFTIICKDVEDYAQTTELVRFYHNTLLAAASTNTSHLEEIMSLEECFRHFRYCLLNQLALLICYDNISKQVIDSYPDSKARNVKKEHFDKVNERCVKAVIATWCTQEAEQELQSFSMKTYEDKKAEEDRAKTPFIPII